MADVMKKLKTDQPTEHFSDDLLIEILLKLRVRSLFLFRSVSKHWLNLIQTPNFINLYNNRPIIRDHQPLLIMKTSEPTYPFSSRFDRTLLSCDNDDVPLNFLFPSVSPWGLNLHLIGPCNGLFCLTDRFDVVLFNPATKRCKKVPHSPSNSQSSDFYDYLYYMGFGFDPISNDYKIVIFDKVRPSANSCEVHFKVRIFSLSTDSWRKLICVMPAVKISTIDTESLFFNGALHWLGGNKAIFSLILVFDLNKEAFKRFELPKIYSLAQHILVYLSVLNESLAMIVRKENDIMELDFDFEIWVMTEYGVTKSWEKLYTVRDIGVERPLSFSKDDFLAETFHGWLVSYNLKTKMFKSFEDHGVRGSLYAFSYRESFVSLK